MANNSASGGEDCVHSLDTDFPKVYIVIMIISFFAILLNVTTILAIKRSMRKLNCHYLLIVQQSCADIIFALSYVPVLTYYLVWCKSVASDVQLCLEAFFNSFVSTACCLVFLNLIAIALDHFVAICNPMKYQIIVTRRRMFAVIGFMYLFFVLTLATPFFIAVTKRNSSNATEHFCSLVPQDVVQHYHGTILFGLSVLVIIPVYVYIFCKVNHCCSDATLRRNSVLVKDVKKTITSLLIIITFMVCFIIDLSSLTAQLHAGSNAVVYYVRLVSFALPSVNCICDPIIYAIRLPKVQRGYHRMWMSLRGRKLDRDGSLSERTRTSLYSNRSSVSDKL